MAGARLTHRASITVAGSITLPARGPEKLGWQVDPTVFDRYAEAADAIAAWELAQVPTTPPRARTVEAVVVGTVVFEQALVALRRLAQEHHSAARFS